MKKLLFLFTLALFCSVGTSFAQTIASVFPDSSHQGQTVTVTITGVGVNFTSGTGASQVRLSGPGNINSSSVSVISPTEMNAQFNLSPLANPGFYNMQVTGYTSAASGIFEITGVPPASQFIYVTGQLYFDDNNNCSRQLSDRPVVGRPVKVGNHTTVTASDGTYGIWVNPGTYTVSFTHANYENYPCGITQTVSSLINGDTISGIDFPIDTVSVLDVRVLASNPLLRPGFTSYQYITVSNAGTVPFSGGQLFHKTNSVLSRKNTFPTPISFVNDTTIWNIPAMAPGQTLTYELTDSLSVTTPLGTPIPRSAWLQYSPLDGNQLNDTVRTFRAAQGSYDPNDKRVYNEHAVEIERFVPPGDSILRYYIRFQNTGNDTAFNIFVRDTIDSQFDLGSIRTLASSHNYVFTMQDSAVQWFFPNILLLDSFSNEPASHGFFEFEIKYNSAYPTGTTFHNTAAIYFDYNAPVITNTTETVICDLLTAGFSATTSGLTANITDNSTSASAWVWDFGDGNTSSLASPSHTYAAAGNYTVCLVATNACGRTDTTCQVVTICTPVVAGFTASASQLVATFVNTSGSSATSWAWDFGDGNTSTLQNPQHTYAAGGNYTVCLIATDVCGNDTSCQTVTVSCVAPVSSFTYAQGTTGIDFTDNSTNSPTSWFWDFGDGSSISVQNPSGHIFPGPGSYTVCLIASSPCGSDTSCQTVVLTGLEDAELESFQIYPNPTASSIYVEGSTTKTVQLSILDMTGRLLKPTVSMDAPGAFKTQLDLNDLATGIYFLEIRSGDAVTRHKIIKQ